SAAEPEERGALGVTAALGDVHSHRRRHRLVHHVVDRPGGGDAVATEWPCEMLLDPARRAVHVQPDRAAREVGRVEIPEHEVSVGHRRPYAAAPVANGAWIGAGALRPDLDETEGADRADAAAARADLEQVDRGHREGKAARLRKAP